MAFNFWAIVGAAALTWSSTSFAQSAKPQPVAPATVSPAVAPAVSTTPAAPPPPTPGATTATKDESWAAEHDPRGISLDTSQTDLVKQVSGYFGNIKGLKGAFVQTGADKKRMKGKFFVKRPGRFRFNYALPSKQVIISDGQNLEIQDLDLNTTDRVELDQTPFRLLLRKDVDLARDARITEIQQADDLIVLGLQDKSPDAPGRIRLFLSTKPSLELKEWVTTDAQGLDTRIEVSELVNSDELDANLFVIQPVGPRLARP